MQRRSWIAAARASVAVIAAGCGQLAPEAPRIATLSIVSGSGQTAPIGSPILAPFVVVVQDQAGKPIEGEAVTWTVLAGGGIITPSKSTTGSDGQVSATLLVGPTPGINRVQAALGSLQSVEFAATAVAAPPAKLLIAFGNAQTGTVATPLASDIGVRVTDVIDRPKPGVVVGFAIPAGDGNLSAASATTDAGGIARVHWTLGTTAGVQSAVATFTGLPPVIFAATAIAGPASGFTIIGGNNQTGAPGSSLPDSLLVRLVDQFGNGIGGVAITWTPGAGSGSVSPGVGTTDATGRVGTRWTLGSIGGPQAVIASGAGFAQPFIGGGKSTYMAVTAGARHTCGLVPSGVAYCWGDHGDGQLGIGAVPPGGGSVLDLPQPTAAAGNPTFARLSAGRLHTCAVTATGVGYCWGNNLDGRVGGGTVGGLVPSPMIVSGGVTWSQIAPGDLHTCGLDLSARPYCWGSNSNGQLGDGTTTNHATPTVGAGAGFSAIASGGLHTCASDGSTVSCWGSNVNGQLGNGTTTGSTTPKDVAGGLGFVAISSGYGHSCAIEMSGSGYCWGANAKGQLGDGSSLGRTLPTLVSGAIAYSAISAGMNHSCGLSSIGVLYCWGLNDKGQLGDGTTSNHAVPTLVAGGLTFKSVSAGDAHTCGITTANLVYCWGDNQFGQLGDGTLTTRLAPTKVGFQP